MKYHFIGIGGSGMIGLARIVKQHGNHVQGSDRGFDSNPDQPKFRELLDLGIELFPQDGAGITPDIDVVVASSAVEDKVPDASAARNLGLQFIRRAELLSRIVNEGFGIAVAGTSGKTTTTGMIESILRSAGRDPTVINGGITKISGFPPHSAWPGSGPEVVAETDESDGSIVLYRPRIGVLTNISLDHKSLDELKILFQQFLNQVKDVVVLGGDDEWVRSLDPGPAGRTIFFGLGPENAIRAQGMELTTQGAEFILQGKRIRLRTPGAHNVLNALAAAAAGIGLGLGLDEISLGLEAFEGIGRRLETLGAARGVRVVDDFAHNPEKIRAAIRALRPGAGRIIVLFQPHGFAPTKLMQDDLVKMFVEELLDTDLLYLLPIYFAGGTVTRDISSHEIVEAIARNRPDGTTFFSETRDAAIESMEKQASNGDVVAVLGARDDSLTDFAAAILARLEKSEYFSH